MTAVMNKGFRAWVRELLEKGVYRSQEHMADSFGVDQSLISLWLAGKRTPGVSSIIHISEATGTPVADIIVMLQEDNREAASSH